MVTLASVTLFSCKKIIEEKQKDRFISVMTNGEWYVDAYMEGTVAMTDLFTGYTFKFEENGTVTSLNGPVKVDGTWTGDIANYSINSNFPSADNPVRKLNGSWRITDTETNYVHAEMTVGDLKKILQLRKK
jgi:hypothetical protein